MDGSDALLSSKHGLFGYSLMDSNILNDHGVFDVSDDVS